jgi:hypothetical protein
MLWLGVAQDAPGDLDGSTGHLERVATAVPRDVITDWTVAGNQRDLVLPRVRPRLRSAGRADRPYLNGPAAFERSTPRS